MSLLGKRAVLHLAYAPGCPACAWAKPAAQAVAKRWSGILHLRMADVTKGERFPIPVGSVPVVVLEVPGISSLWILRQELLDGFMDESKLETWLLAGLHRFLNATTQVGIAS